MLEQLEQIISYARAICELIKTQKGIQIKEIIPLLEKIIAVDLEQLAKTSNFSEKGKKIVLTLHAIISDLSKKIWKAKISEIEDSLNRIIFLEERIAQEIPFVIPSSILKKVLNYTPAKAREKGFLFRGLSETDYQKVVQGESIFSALPNGEVSIEDHILDPTNNPKTQFISLTADASTAKKFGKVIAINVKRIRGRIIPPEEIESILRRTSSRWNQAKKLQKKNTEFLLGPTKRELAEIPASAILH